MKAAILGMGAMGQVHKAVYEAAGVEVVATYDPKDSKSTFSICKEQARNPDGYGTVSDTIKQADIVSVCSTDDVHAAQVIQALDSNKHVFCEKPLCHTRREFEAIKAAYEPKKHRCALGINFPLRWHKPFVEAKRRIDELGEIYLIEADYEYGRWEKYSKGWRGQMNDYDIMMGGGLHMIDIVLWMTGYDIAFAHGHVDRRKKTRAFVCLYSLSNESVFKVTADFGGSKNHARRLRICGTQDSLYIDDREPTDKGRALEQFLDCLKQRPADDNFTDGFLEAIEDLPSPSQIFRVHEIGLSL